MRCVRGFGTIVKSMEELVDMQRYMRERWYREGVRVPGGVKWVSGIFLGVLATGSVTANWYDGGCE